MIPLKLKNAIARRYRGRVLPLVFAAGLLGTPGLVLTPVPALAQNEPPPPEGEGDKSGRPLDGYLATGCLVGLALFIIAKSARR